MGLVGHIDGMESKRGGMTAGELLAQQATDPLYQAARSAKNWDLAQIAEQRRREQQPLLNDLSAAGVIVDWVGQLCSNPDPDERIYRVLLDHLAKPYSPWLLEWIGRAFARKSARPIVWDTLVDVIKTHALDERATGGVMAAISDMAQPSDLAILIELLSDPSLGSSRVFLVGNLMRSRRPAARDALLRHQDDPDLTKEITSRLSRTRG
jgi:hypothetical protein